MTDFSSADSNSDTRPTPPPDRPTLGYEISDTDIQQAIEWATPILEQERFPTYLLDRNFYIHAANQLMLGIVGMDKAAATPLFGQINVVDMLFNPMLGIAQVLDKGHLEQLIVDQIQAISLDALRGPSPASREDFFNHFCNKYPPLSQLLHNLALQDAPKAEKREIYLTDGKHTFCFDLVIDVFLPDDRFQIVEYYPRDLITMDFLRQLKQRTLGRGLDLSPSTLSTALRNWNDLASLQKSPLIQLKGVALLAEEKGLSPVEALRDVLRDAIEACAPDRLTGETRSKPRIKYEILRMTAYESATEEQIMWDLGFEPEHDLWANGNPDKARSPRYPYRGKGDYGATSRASFKRLKNQALDDLAWQLEQREQ